MTKTLLQLSFAAMLALSTAAGAQEAATNSASDSGAAPQDAPPAVGLDTGREVAAENQPYIRETHGDWSLRCIPNEVEGKEDDPCQMYQLLTESEGNPVAEFMLYRLDGTGTIAAGVTIAVPLGTLLTEELKLSVDDAKAKSYAFSYCTMAGCFSRIGLTGPEIEAMKAGAEAQIEIIPAQAPDQTVRIGVSLKGFTAAYEAASTLKN
ncbi:invasion protein IalB [Roseovarius sp. MBR-78]|jgi:invasion protein IalB|uniref:invasion associated locus B family protein n=1 Tax=Roseovarius sp. MBR-78 TaxID=3156460 RepID=UPI003398A1A4